MENCDTALKIREIQPKTPNFMKLSWKVMKTNRKAWEPVKLPWKPTENYHKKWNTREGLFFVTHTQKALIFCDLWKGSVLCASAWNIDHHRHDGNLVSNCGDNEEVAKDPEEGETHLKKNTWNHLDIGLSFANVCVLEVAFGCRVICRLWWFSIDNRQKLEYFGK